MNDDPGKNTAFSRAFARWFADYDAERRRQKKRMGANLIGFAAPPVHPDQIADTIARAGRSRALDALGIHRTTLDRYLTGDSVIPRAHWLLLCILADGLLPGMSDDWRQFRFDGDRLAIVGTRYSYSAREIAGWHYQIRNLDIKSRRIDELERRIAHLLEIGQFGAANDALMASR